MSSIYDKYEPVIGLEIHIQLLTQSKAYSSDSAAFTLSPNSNISPITLGHPGTLPKANKKVIEYAVKLGLACGCEITRENQYARKNYFYADLPKGYQITQDKTPICTGGHINIKNNDGSTRKIKLTRIHMEEDAGKSMHDQDMYDSLVDLNRAGVPLLEMVSDPDIRSGEEAYKYVTEVRKLVRYLEICDGNMEEGSMRCDANISVRLKGESKFGQKVEVKNMNSIRNVQRAIEFEIIRQIDAIEAGGTIDQETRSFDAVNGSTFSLRSKEMANDYRYFPEPDLAPVIVDEVYVDEVKKAMPPLPEELLNKFVHEFKLSDYDAGVLTENKEFALYYLALTKHTNNYKAASNWLTVNIKAYLNETAQEIENFNIKPEKIAAIIRLIDDNKISNSIATQKVFPALIDNPNAEPEKMAVENNWIMADDDDSLQLWIQEALNAYPDKVAEYRAGKKGLLGLFMGEVMKKSGGKADPKVANKKVRDALEAE
jgi:aspartyl-tRNA(Asn)/glutamyl-tRNA(Gln) amidotransferase subunit B